MKHQQIAITGAGGFIGRSLVAHLAPRGVRISALCGNEAETDAVRPSVNKLVVGDVLDPAVLDAVMEGTSAVVHLAGPPSVADSFNHPDLHARVHILGTLAVLDAMRRHGVRRLVYTSSAEVYGSGGEKPVTEDSPLKPRSPYGAAKVAAEHFVRVRCATDPISAVVVRPFNIYGPGSPPHGVVPAILRQVLNSDQVALSNLRPVRDYCYIADLVRGLDLALSADQDGYLVANLGSGTGTSVQQLAETALAVAGRSIPIVQHANPDRPRGADIDRLVADVSQARSHLGWEPTVSLADGLAMTVKSLGEHP